MKSLSQVIKDGDSIREVIRGSGILVLSKCYLVVAGQLGTVCGLARGNRSLPRRRRQLLARRLLSNLIAERRSRPIGYVVDVGLSQAGSRAVAGRHR